MRTDLFLQHAKLKAQYPGVILLLRVGDFYEALDEDADTLARVCKLTKTTRGPNRMAGFPLVQLDGFLIALIRAGFRVATAEPVLEKSLPGKPAVVRWPSAEEGR